ncbi:MAG: hypothetical protein LBG99_08060 [Propionibacteriaceae bacterium]|jgi:hypothetical protein|nr:hypothetical protein [Propionibacteriaceae bacterium]
MSIEFSRSKNSDVCPYFSGPYDAIMDPEARLQADYWQRHQQLDPSILEHHVDADVLSRPGVRISELWCSSSLRLSSTEFNRLDNKSKLSLLSAQSSVGEMGHY